MAKSKIEWTDRTWNPITGCTKISAGCKNCYAERMSKRLAGRCGYHADDPFRVALHPGRLHEPLSWRKPQRVFVCSMGDLFHKDVPEEFICDVLDVIEQETRHTFIILTKRPERMRDLFAELDFSDGVYPNLWLGVSTENQAMADERIPLLLQTPAIVRFVSVEPMLERVDLEDYLDYPIVGWQSESGPYDSPIYQMDAPRLDWVICGSESGHGARPFDADWARSLKDQCENFEIPFFLKQMPVDGKLVKMPELDGKVWDQMPCVPG